MLWHTMTSPKRFAALGNVSMPAAGRPEDRGSEQHILGRWPG
ncbi:hypothetical protein IW245_001889 [Longispora fulva]|uniref:Uncharacterized protein n=1 Tax=Longispora fulva TaxID=619741 RepID=A0A8J7GCV4_9ACTN|nr:hypothetical protein [Longispora fulva]